MVNSGERSRGMTTPPAKVAARLHCPGREQGARRRRCRRNGWHVGDERSATAVDACGRWRRAARVGGRPARRPRLAGAQRGSEFERAGSPGSRALPPRSFPDEAGTSCGRTGRALPVRGRDGCPVRNLRRAAPLSSVRGGIRHGRLACRRRSRDAAPWPLTVDRPAATRNACAGVRGASRLRRCDGNDMAIAAGTLRGLTGPGRKDRAWPRQPGGGSGPMVVGAHATMSWRFTKCSSGSIGGSEMPAASAIVFSEIAASAGCSFHGGW